MGDYRDNQKKENHNELLQVAEMYRDQLWSSQKSGSVAFLATDKAIKNYYKLHPCPHRIKAIKPIKTGGGCETTVEMCHDCGTVLSAPETDC